MSTDQKAEMSSTEESDHKKLSTKEKLKKAVKEYGSTVIIFHVTISMISLGSCYLLISRYVLTLTFLLTLFFKGLPRQLTNNEQKKLEKWFSFIFINVTCLLP